MTNCTTGTTAGARAGRRIAAKPMQEIKGLTSLRGIAALAVVAQHFSSTAQSHASVTIPSLVPHGYVAVDFFFVLSGYIMCYTYLGSFRSNGWAAYWPFLKKRAIRLLPLNAFVVCCLLVLGSLSASLLGRNIFFGDVRLPFDVLVNLLMLQGLGIGTNLNGPSWSVSAEFLAYVSLPLLIVGVFSARRGMTALTALLALSLLGVVAAANPRLGLGSEGPLLGGLRCISEFVLGMLAYRFGQVAERKDWLSRDSLAFGLFALCGVLLLIRIDFLTALTFPAIVVATAHNQHLVKRLLSTPALHFLGAVSYSLYLIHDPFRPAELELLRYFHPTPLTGGAALMFAVAGTLSVIPFAWLCFRWIEEPSRTFLRRRALAPAQA